jgi:hypothetical protein
MLKFHNLKIALDALIEAKNVFHAAVVTEQGDYFIPGPTGVDDRHRIADALCQMWFEDAQRLDLPRSGLLCASEPTLAAAQRLNNAKDTFRDAIKELKDYSKARDGERLKLWVRNALSAKNQRDPEVAEGLRKSGFASLRLQSCTRHIGILPAGLKSVSWSWDRQSYEVTEKTREQVRQMIMDEIAAPDRREHALEQLAAIPAGVRLAYRARTPARNKLRANITLRKGVAYSGTRFPYAASVFLIPDAQLPEVTWPDSGPPGKLDQFDDEAPAGRTREVSRRLEPEPCIKSIGIYRYRNQEVRDAS